MLAFIVRVSASTIVKNCTFLPGILKWRSCSKSQSTFSLRLLEREEQVPQQKNLNIDAIAAKTSGFSGADLAGLVDTAVELAIEDSLKDDGIVPVSSAHLTAALKEMKPSTLEWLSSARNYAKYANQGGLYDDVVAFLDRHSR